MIDQLSNLSERVVLLRQKKAAKKVTAREIEKPLSFRASSWLKILNDNKVLQKRLDGLGLTEEEFIALINQKPAELDLQAVFDVVGANLDVDSDSKQSEALSSFFDQKFPITAFFDIVEPILYPQQQQLEVELAERYPDYLGGLKAEILQCKRGLGQSLFDMINRTLVLDLNVSRELDLLLGDTPEERFNYYLNSLKKPSEFERLLVEYPALFKLLHTYLENWRKNSFELICRLVDDHTRLEEELGIKADVVVKVQLGAGDAHNGGKTVCIITFQSGAKVVYKPRSLNTDVHFQHIIKWINKQDLGFNLKTLRLINQNDYGWVEFIEQLPCSNELELEEFYKKLGALLALLYVINATDFHYENIIAHGADPTLIDLETLLTPNTTERISMQGLMEDSVLRISILPTWRYYTHVRKRIDLSGVSDAGGQKSPILRPAWDAFQTDQMRIERREVLMEGSKNYPTLNGERVGVVNYVSNIETGFRLIYSLIERNKSLFIGVNGFIDTFKGTSVRVVLRNTSVYGQLLNSSFHPDYLMHYLDRDKLFDHLWYLQGSSELSSNIIQKELDTLAKLDIPLFATYSDSRDVWLDHTHRFTDFYTKTGEECCKEKIISLGETDLERQCWLIRSSIASALPNQINNSDLRYLEEGSLPVATELLIEEARYIGNRLSQLAIHTDDGGVGWYGFSLQGDVYQVMPIGVDLYSGLPGIILFLSHLSDATGDLSYGTLASKALSTLDGYIDSILAQRRGAENLGAFDGLGGCMYFYSQMSMLSNNNAFKQRALQLGDVVAEWIDDIDSHDVIGGLSGIILAYLSLYRVTKSAAALQNAIRCGEALLRRAVPMSSGGVGWLQYSESALTGFGHGAGGVAYALAKLYQATADTRFQDLLQDAIRYERSQFQQDKGNWADLRSAILEANATKSTEAEVNMTAWCTGATGIGLSRLGMRDVYEDSEFAEETKVALYTTLAHGMGLNHSLCHGDSGSLEYLLQYNKAYPDAMLNPTITELLGSLRFSFQKHGYISGVALGMETPGLMTGLAGLGYQLLRTALPDRLPSILLLESM